MVASVHVNQYLCLFQVLQSISRIWATAKFAYGGSILGSSHFTLLSQMPLKMMLDLKVVKIDLKIIISLR